MNLIFILLYNLLCLNVYKQYWILNCVDNIKIFVLCILWFLVNHKTYVQFKINIRKYVIILIMLTFLLHACAVYLFPFQRLFFTFSRVTVSVYIYFLFICSVLYINGESIYLKKTGLVQKTNKN